ncbi:hypothetical protein [Clostridium saccharoperbutylacetonicum]|uniref:hypothetical protein n=1 Tax=Clostridium saccharoperbutylacetonicum TaxID=36745 RepID=UPI0039E903AF
MISTPSYVNISAIASLHSEKVEGKFTIFVLQISVEGTGHIGAVGATGKIGVDQCKLKVEGNASALLGVGVSVSVGLAD